MTKILKFPHHRIVRDVPLEALAEQERRGKRAAMDKLHENFIEWTFDQFEEWGFDTSEQSLRDDLTVMLDVCRAALYRQHGLEHHLHEWIDDNVVIAPREKVEADFQAKQEEARAKAPTAENTGILSVEVPLKV